MISSRRDWLPPPLVGAEVGREGRGMMSGDMVRRCDWVVGFFPLMFRRLLLLDGKRSRRVERPRT